MENNFKELIINDFKIVVIALELMYDFFKGIFYNLSKILNLKDFGSLIELKHCYRLSYHLKFHKQIMT